MFWKGSRGKSRLVMLRRGQLGLDYVKGEYGKNKSSKIK